MTDDVPRLDLSLYKPRSTDTARDAEELERAIEKARRALSVDIPTRYRAADVTDPAVQAWVDRYHEDEDTAPSLLLFGPTGVGKTQEAFGAIRAAITPRRAPLQIGSHAWSPTRWEYVTYPGLNDDLRPRDNGKHRDAMDRFQKIPLLLIDDLGTGKITDWTADTTYRLIDSRWAHCRATIFTTNLTPVELNAALGDRITSRLAGMCVRVSLKGDDRRRTAA